MFICAIWIQAPMKFKNHWRCWRYFKEQQYLLSQIVVWHSWSRIVYHLHVQECGLPLVNGRFHQDAELISQETWSRSVFHRHVQQQCGLPLAGGSFIKILHLVKKLGCHQFVTSMCNGMACCLQEEGLSRCYTIFSRNLAMISLSPLCVVVWLTTCKWKASLRFYITHVLW